MHTICRYILRCNEKYLVRPGPEMAWIAWAIEGYFLLTIDDEQGKLLLRTQMAFICSPEGKLIQIQAGSDPHSKYEISTLLVSLKMNYDNSFYADMLRRISGKSIFKILNPDISAQSFCKNNNILTPAESALILDSLLALSEKKEPAIVMQSSPDEDEESVFLIAEKLIIEMDEDWSLEKLLRIGHFNDRKLKEMFKKHIGMPVAKFRTFIRIEKARQLLVETSLPIQHISLKVGYPNPAHFCKLFKQKTGFTPSHIRKESRNYCRMKRPPRA